MKITKLVLLILTVNLGAAPAGAQQDGESNTLFAQTDFFQDVGFMLAPGYALTSMDGATAHLLQVRGGVVLKDRFTLGGFFSLSLNEIYPTSETIPNVYMDYRVGGGFLEYTLHSGKMIHLTFPLFIGAGEVEMDNEAGEADLGEQNFFLVEPAALLEINLHRNARLNVGAGYRFIGEMTYRNFNQSNLAGISGQIGLKLGLF